MSAWYYVIDADDAEFLTAEPDDDIEPGRPVDWTAAISALSHHVPSGADNEFEFELPGLWVQVEPVDDDGEIRGLAFNVGTTAGEDRVGMAALVKLMLAVADDLHARVWSDDQQRWLTLADIEAARNGEPV